MSKQAIFFTAFAGLAGLTGVATGALAAHAITDTHAAQMITEASTYEIIHAAVLLALLHFKTRLGKVACWLFVAGIIGFGFGIDAKYILHIYMSSFIIPTGGSCLMLGWLIVALSPFFVFEKNNPHEK